MEIGRRWFPPPSLSAITAGVAVALGLLMSIGGFALAVGVLSSSQSWLQVITACALITAGVVNLRASSGIRHQESRSLLVSGAATIALMLYLGAGLRDFGEPFWAHGLYVLLLLALAMRQRRLMLHWIPPR